MKIKKFLKSALLLYPNLRFKTNASLKNYTTFKIGGKTKLIVFVSQGHQLLNLIDLARKAHIKYFILGAGSNLLIGDVDDILFFKIEINYLVASKNKIYAGAGVSLFKLHKLAIQNGLAGLEFLFGVPGSVGGAVATNAGAYGGEICDVIENVVYISGNKIYKKKKSFFEFSYRNSIFMQTNFVVVGVELNLLPSSSSQVRQKCIDIFKRRLLSQPYAQPSAGSVFKKPEGTHAPTLIESCGLKGLRCGGAQVSTKHCGFVVNLKNAKFVQVVKIICKIKKTVYKKFGIMLQEEIIVLGKKPKIFSRLSHTHNLQPKAILAFSSRQRHNRR